MSVLPNRVRRRLRTPAGHARAAAALWRTRDIDTSTIERFCFFVGFQRSGSSLMGALLNAHPDVVIAHEVDVLYYVRRPGFTRAELVALMLDKDRRFARRGSRTRRYDYGVEGQWQGRHRTLRVLGDKKAGATGTRLGTEPWLLDDLRAVLDAPVRIIQPVRNPFDNIATMAQRNDWPLDEAVHRYARNAAVVARLQDELAEDGVVAMRLEEFVANPRDELARLCDFVGVEAGNDYLDACAKIVFDRPKRTRRRTDWPPDLREHVESLVARHPFLGGYGFEGAG